MTKKCLAVFLAIILIIAAAPSVFARPADDGWLIYYENFDGNTFNAIIVAPAEYTRVSGSPRIETINTEDRTENTVLTPSTGQTDFYFNGKTQTHLTLTASCSISDGSFPGYSLKLAILPGSLLDSSGNGNPRVYFDDETDYLEAAGYVGINAYSSLLRRDYSSEDDTVAVGDTLRVDYSGLYPADIFINGEKEASRPGGEMQIFTCEITGTGDLDVVIRQKGSDVKTRSLTVITSKEMYERNLHDGLITGDDIPGTDDLVDVGIPEGSIFISLAKIIAFFVALRDFLQRLFSFTRVSE
ncbi:MAG: hypothetical protein K6G90_10685 [Clostridia bacterium]|nr:hypothetical protein [Clostridia bacterium]